ncbi:MAG: hypothetical protein PHY34_01945 [Patescibacteria group bacterium]|nr:hypothetical protein [Patescibacteria group bacterium]MDD5715303.1 hypothetical protein [Patescibacteria group bacterium]
MITKLGKKATQDEIRERAMKAGAGWHHHCLSRECYANDTGKEIIVFECGDDMLYCDSSKELREELEEHAYQLNKPKRRNRKPVKHEALDLVRKYVKTGEKWHFHIAMPHCLLSMANCYTLIVENDSTKGKHEWIFDAKPVELVRAIDDYYLERKK